MSAGAVAAAGMSLRAHHRGSALPAQGLQPVETRRERRLAHVVGVGAKAGVAPGRVVGDSVRCLTALGGSAPAPQLLAEALVVDTGLRQRCRETVGSEMRMPAGARVTAHIGDRLDAGAPEQLDEMVDRVGRMADGQDLRRRFLHRYLSMSISGATSP